MSEKEESELAKSLKRIETALMGDMSGDNPGAIHTLRMICQDYYRPDNPKRAVPERLTVLEDERQKRLGAMAACTAIGSIIGFLCSMAVKLLHF